MAKAPRNFRAMKRTGIITVYDGPSEGPYAAPAIDLRLRKRGALRVIDDISQIPLLGEGIEYLVKGTLTGFKQSGLKAGDPEQMKAAGAAIQEAIRKAAADEGTPFGKAVRDLIIGLPRLIENTIVEDVILEDGEDPEDLRDLVRSFGTTALVNTAIGWIEFNMPEYRDFLVLKLREVMTKGRTKTREVGPAETTADAPSAPVGPDPKAAPDAGENSLAA